MRVGVDDHDPHKHAELKRKMGYGSQVSLTMGLSLNDLLCHLGRRLNQRKDTGRRRVPRPGGGQPVSRGHADPREAGHRRLHLSAQICGLHSK